MSFQLDESEVGTLVQHIFRDYQTAAHDPLEKRRRDKTAFDAVGLPEKPVIRAIHDFPAVDEQDLANYLTLTAAINYKKETSGPTGIWATTWGLLKYEPWLFDPQNVVERGEAAVLSVFRNEPIMNLEDPEIYAYDNPDVAIWMKNASPLARQYDADPRELLKSQEHDAPSLQQYLNKTREFPFLSGTKINPLWLRLMHEEIHELSRIDEISIPVDRHIRTVTQQLQRDPAQDDDEIRAYWDRICTNAELVPVRLDQPLWILGKYWDSIGNAYVSRKLDALQQ